MSKRLSLIRRPWAMMAAWLMLTLTAWSALPNLNVLHAQDEEEAEAAEVEPAASEKGAAAPAAADTTSETKSQSALWWLIETSGFIGLVLLVLSIYFVATIVQLFVEFRDEVAAPPELVAQCDDLLKKRDFMGIYKAAKGDESFFGTVLSAGVSELPNGVTEAREAMDLASEAVIARMEKKISILAVLGSLGPMIGLLGTLKGMISSFSVIALSDTQLKASEVAGGISEALVLTFEGVGLAVPAIYFFAVFKNRVSTISAHTILKVDELLRRIHAAIRGKAPAAAPTA